MTRSLLLLSTVILLASPLFPQTTIRVPQDHTTIQAAIDAAVDGDTVLVAENTYTENVVITKKIFLASMYIKDGNAAHITNTIIDGSNPNNPDSAATVTFGPGTDTTSVIAGFTITGGKGNRHRPADGTTFKAGGGIDIFEGGATVRFNEIRGNLVGHFSDSTIGAGICAARWGGEERFDVIVEYNTINDNEAHSTGISDGGGVAFAAVSGRIRGNHIRHNSTNYSAGILLWSSVQVASLPDTVIAHDNLIESNDASVNIGGVTVTGGMMVGYIRHNTIIDNRGVNIVGGIGIGYGARAYIESNYIARNDGGNRGGIYVWTNPVPTVSIVNNIIVHNVGDAITANLGAFITVTNNTIVDNTGYGITGNSTSVVRSLNNIVLDNGSGPFGSLIGFNYVANTLVPNGYSGPGYLTGDPKFLTGDSLYTILDSSSVCHNAGADSALLGGVMIYAPKRDFRPQIERTSPPDIGAYEIDGVTSIKIFSELVPEQFGLSQNYPNPFNPTTNFGFRIADFGLVRITVFDILGREVTVLVNDELDPGSYQTTWDASGMTSGIYFYRLEVVGGGGVRWVQTKKMVLLH